MKSYMIDFEHPRIDEDVIFRATSILNRKSTKCRWKPSYRLGEIKLADGDAPSAFELLSQIKVFGPDVSFSSSGRTAITIYHPCDIKVIVDGKERVKGEELNQQILENACAYLLIKTGDIWQYEHASKYQQHPYLHFNFLPYRGERYLREIYKFIPETVLTPGVINKIYIRNFNDIKQLSDLYITHKSERERLFYGTYGDTKEDRVIGSVRYLLAKVGLPAEIVENIISYLDYSDIPQRIIPTTAEQKEKQVNISYTGPLINFAGAITNCNCPTINFKFYSESVFNHFVKIGKYKNLKHNEDELMLFCGKNDFKQAFIAFDDNDAASTFFKIIGLEPHQAYVTGKDIVFKTLTFRKEITSQLQLG